MTTVLEIKITSPDGATRDYSFDKSQIDSSTDSLVTIAPNEIADIDIEKWPYSPVDVAKYISLQPGEVDLETEIHRPTRDEIESSFEFCGSDGWDYDGLGTLEFSPRFVWVHGQTFDGWLWALELTQNTCATVLVTDEGIATAVEVANYSWFSESGGPVSWDGRSLLFDLGNNVFAAVANGDVQEDAFVWKTNGSKEALVRLVADFCLDDNRITDIALCLEENYDSPLAVPHSDEVCDVVTGLKEYGGIDFGESFTHLDELKTLLAKRSEQYRFIRDFFDDPMNPKFAELWAAMKEAAETGFTGEVTGDGAAWYWNLHKLAKEGKY